MPPFEYYAWSTRERNTQDSIRPSSKNVPSLVAVNVEFTVSETASIYCISETRGTAAQVSKCEGADFRHRNLLRMIDQIKEPKIPLQNINQIDLLSPAQSFLANATENKKKQYPSQTPSRRPVLGHMKVLHRLPIMFLTNVTLRFSCIQSIGFKYCVDFRWNCMSPRLRLLR